MRVVITEDIISRALNESIDEFMLEEGWLGDKWNGFKNNTIAGQWLTKAGNWLNNAAAMYMDGKTGGRWNRTYNTQATGNGNNVSVGTYYLKNWFETHYSRLYDIIYGEQYGSKMCYTAEIDGRDKDFRHEWKTNTYEAEDRKRNIVYRFNINNGEPGILSVYNASGTEIGRSTSKDVKPEDGSYLFKFPNALYNLTIYSREDDTTPEAYIAKNCTPDSFDRFTRNTLEDGPFKQAVKYYLESQVFDYIEKNGGRNGTKNNINYGYLISLFTLTHYIQWYSKNKQQIDNAIKQSGSKPTQAPNTTNSQPTSSSSQPTRGKKDPNKGNLANGVPNLMGGGKFMP